MRMWHPALPYTKAEGQETTEEAFVLAWEPRGWKVWPPRKVKIDRSGMDQEPGTDVVEVEDE